MCYRFNRSQNFNLCTVKNEIKKIESVVKKLLERDRTYSDSDSRLCCKVWLDELTVRGVDAKEFSVYDFFLLLFKNEITTAGSITRARRKLEENFPALRGITYNERHKIREPEVKEELREIDVKHFNDPRLNLKENYQAK